MLFTSLILKFRHLCYDKGWIKSAPTEVPSICVGNVAVGGTGKTPLTELIIRTLQEDDIPDAEPVVREEDIQFDGLFANVGLYDGTDFGGHATSDKDPRHIAVLSRGYGRKSKGFQHVTVDGTVEQFGDEPLQIKRKFPSVTVVVDENRTEGAARLANPQNGEFPKADIIILDDAYQHRKVVPNKSIILTTFDNPFYKDHLMPWGRLRDLRSRVLKADMIIVTKCPIGFNDWDREQIIRRMGITNFDYGTCTGVNAAGRKQIILFSTILYDTLQPVFPEGDPRYTHSQSFILATGIADDSALESHLSKTGRMMGHYKFGDHHLFSEGDIRQISRGIEKSVTSVVVTTEKDAQRLRDFEASDKSGAVSKQMRIRMFYAPIRAMILTPLENNIFKEFINNL